MEIPKEIWMLWMDDVERYVLAIDDSNELFLCTTNEPDAVLACEHQMDGYEIKCRPIRVK